MSYELKTKAPGLGAWAEKRISPLRDSRWSCESLRSKRQGLGRLKENPPFRKKRERMGHPAIYESLRSK
jgi:hypothetical protein